MGTQGLGRHTCSLLWLRSIPVYGTLAVRKLDLCHEVCRPVRLLCDASRLRMFLLCSSVAGKVPGCHHAFSIGWHTEVTSFTRGFWACLACSSTDVADNADGLG